MNRLQEKIDVLSNILPERVPERGTEANNIVVVDDDAGDLAIAVSLLWEYADTDYPQSNRHGDGESHY